MLLMDLFHRASRGQDTRIGRECQFCRNMDPDFFRRRPMDRLVQSKLADVASAHMTEEGYVKHRIAELVKKQAAMTDVASLRRSA
jgi:hypothetical protein